MKRTTKQPLNTQMKRRIDKPVEKKSEYEGNTETMISTGSTLLDLAISGGRIRGGGIPGGILVEIFGPSGSGKTVLLCEIAGAIQRTGGSIMFHDPEARLNKQFAQIFNLKTDEMDYDTPNKIPEVFSAVRGWDVEEGKIHGIMADSLAALSTDMEMTNDEGDKMGMRRAKEFSEELRKTCRILAQKNFLMIASNQVRINVNAGPYGQKYTAPGGTAIEFYSSLRLRTIGSSKLKEKRTIRGKEENRIIGIETQIEVAKSSIWKPYRKAPVSILFDYGIDDVRENLKFVKRYTGTSVYSINGESINNSLEKAIKIVEKTNREDELREEVIDLWEEIEEKFKFERKPKKR